VTGNRKRVLTLFVMLLPLATANTFQSVVLHHGETVSNGRSIHVRTPVVDAVHHSIPERTVFKARYLPKATRTGFEHLMNLSIATSLQYHNPILEDTRCSALFSSTTSFPYYYHIHTRHRTQEKKTMPMTT
jgi:hypothetical protein